MTDFQTRRALDELADLYLTGPEPVRLDAPAARASAASHAGNGHGSAAVSPSLRLSRVADVAAAPLVHGLLLGHLPGYASPWVSQYAHHVGASQGGAVLIRLHGQVVEVELFSDVKLPAQSGVLSETLEQLADAASAWIVLIDEPTSGPAGKRLADLPRWTLLSGADDAAVVGGYRLLKTVLADGGGTPPTEGVSVMFMGCDEADAAEALERLNRAASAFLKAPIESAGTRQRMQPVRRRYVGHYDIPAGQDAWSVIGPFLCELRELDTESGPVDAELVHLERAIEPPAAPAAAAALDEDVVRFSAVMFPEFKPAAIVEAPVVDARVEPESERDAKPQVAEVITATTLADHVSATALAARCPRHPQVELALDDAGVMHLLLHTPTSANVPGDEALRRLMQVRAWATEHRDLLALTCSPRKLDATAAPQMHLFTATVAAALPLADLGVHIHLLRTVNLAGQQVVVHEPLG